MKLTQENFYQGMSDQPDCCGSCGARLDQVKTDIIDGEVVYICECLDCSRVVGVIDMGELN